MFRIVKEKIITRVVICASLVQNYCPELLCKALRIGTISLPDVQRLPIEFKKPSVKMAASISCLCKSADPRKENGLRFFSSELHPTQRGHFTITNMEMTKNARKTQVGRLKRNWTGQKIQYWGISSNIREARWLTRAGNNFQSKFNKRQCLSCWENIATILNDHSLNVNHDLSFLICQE